MDIVVPIHVIAGILKNNRLAGGSDSTAYLFADHFRDIYNEHFDYDTFVEKAGVPHCRTCNHSKDHNQCKHSA